MRSTIWTGFIAGIVSPALVWSLRSAYGPSDLQCVTLSYIPAAIGEASTQGLAN